MYVETQCKEKNHDIVFLLFSNNHKQIQREKIKREDKKERKIWVKNNTWAFNINTAQAHKF